MKQFTVKSNDTETSGKNFNDRLAELSAHKWNHSKSLALAESEGIDLNNEHWSVIVFLRKYYLDHGLPITARTTSRELNKNFIDQGGNKYLHQLFNGGPVAQGSRLAICVPLRMQQTFRLVSVTEAINGLKINKEHRT